MNSSDAYQLLNTLSQSNTSNAGAEVWAILAPILAIVGAILLYFLFVHPTAEPKNPTAKAIKDFLSFKTMKVEALVKMFYYACTFYCVLTSFNWLTLGTDFIWQFFSQLLLGPIVIRLVYELVMVLIGIWHNTKKN